MTGNPTEDLPKTTCFDRKFLWGQSYKTIYE